MPPSRWKLASSGATFDFLHGYSLAGVSLYVRHFGIVLRQGRPQYYSPDPAYLEKEACLLHALARVAGQPQEQVGLFIDEISSTRWPQPSFDWCDQAPAPRPLADRKQSR